MAGSPKFKVYRGKEYVAACKYAEDAAAVAALTPDSIVKYDHSLVVWREGHETFSAGNSYDQAASVMLDRIRDNHKAALLKRYGTVEAMPTIYQEYFAA